MNQTRPRKSHQGFLPSKRPADQVSIDLTSPTTSSISGKTSHFTANESKIPNYFQTTIVLPTGKNAPQSTRMLDVVIAHYVIANSLPLSHAEDYLFNRILKYARNTNNTYKPPSKHEISTDLLNATYESYYNDEVSKLMIDASIFGIAIYGDGATINTVPKINILAASAHNPGCVLDVIDCTTQMGRGGKKDATYISNQMLPLMKKIDPKKELISMIAFDGASNVQKAGEIMEKHFTRATVIHGSEHVVNIIFEKITRCAPFAQYSNFCKMVCNTDFC